MSRKNRKKSAQAISKKDKRVNSSELGSTGLHMYAGKVNEEILHELRGISGTETYRQMADNDPSIGALLFSVQQMITPLKWSVLPSDSKNKQSRSNAEFLDECMHDMAETWEDTITSILSYLPYGFSVHEIVYKSRRGSSPSKETEKSAFEDRKVGWKHLPIRSQSSIQQGRWVFDEDNIDLLAVEQMAPPMYKRQIIPAKKFLHFRTTNQKNSPEGKSILRNAYRPWYFKRNIENIEGIGIERDLGGLPVITAPAEIMSPKANAAQKGMYNSLKDIVSNVRSDEQAGVIMPSTRDENGHLLYELSLLASPGAKQYDTCKIIERYRNEILSTVIADFITLGQGVAGTQALAQTKVDLFLNAIQSWVGQIEAVFNRFAIPRLFEVNGITENLPTLSAEKIKKTDLDQFAKNMLIMSQAGMDLFPSEALDEFVRNLLGLPENTKEDKTWFDEQHEAELESLKPDPKPDPNVNDTTGQTGEQNPDDKDAARKA